jgi:hypothetical protein|nr:hypothetical protein [Bacteroides intestinalis]
MKKNNKGMVAGVAHEQAEKELGRSNIFFRNFLANLEKGRKTAPIVF